MNFKQMRVLLLVFVFFTLCFCASSASDDSTAETLTITGTVSILSLQNSATSFAAAFNNTELDGAHVNVCTVQDGVLATLPGQSSVLTDSSGAFTISVDVGDIPESRQMWVCAAAATSGDYAILAPIPEDLLPSDTNEVATVSVDPNTNSTIITRYACGQNVMLFNTNKCLAVDNDQSTTLHDALDAYFTVHADAEPDLSATSQLWNDLANDETVRSLFESWLSEIDGVSYDDFIADAQEFAEPAIPLASTDDLAIEITGFACDMTTTDGITTVTLSAAGTVAGDSVDVFTVFFSVDSADLTAPETLGCGNWEQTGGAGSCTKTSVSSSSTSFIGSSELLYNEGLEPTTIEVFVEGYASGSATALVSESETTTCQ